MDFEKIALAIVADLQTVAQHSPNERLPKEEQIRSCIYAALRPDFEAVCVERGYSSIDDKSSIEVDIWAKRSSGSYWIEIKRCWHISARGWIHKPDEQRRSWQADLDKLAKVSIDETRVFILVGVLDAHPLENPAAARKGVLMRMSEFYPAHLRYSVLAPFTWRQSPASHLSVSMWEWTCGERI